MGQTAIASSPGSSQAPTSGVPSHRGQRRLRNFLLDSHFQLKYSGYLVGVATTRVLIDTPSSQVVDVSPKGSDTLGVRANLIASLMVDGANAPADPVELQEDDAADHFA